MLLNYNADVNSRDNFGSTALHVAVSNEYNEKHFVNYLQISSADSKTMQTEVIVKLLISKGANVDAKRKDEMTALHIATCKGYETIVQVLLENILDVNCRDADGVTPIYFAAAKGNKNIAKMLLEKGANIGAEGKNKVTALHIAVVYGHTELVKHLLDYNADVNSREINNMTPLYSAVKNGSEEIAKMLLDKGADVNIKDTNGINALHIVAISGNENIAKLLLRFNADVNSRDINNITPLYFAAQSEKIAIVKLILDKGADVNAANKKGTNASHIADLNGDHKPLKLLLEYDKFIKNQNSFITGSLFCQSNDLNTSKFDSLTALHIAVLYEYDKIVELLLDYKADVNSQDINKITPLYFAVQKRNILILKLLLDKNADVNLSYDNGITVLHIAAFNDDEKISKLLLDLGNGPNVNSADHMGITALHIASKNGYAMLARLLLEYNANPNSKCKKGLTPLNYTVNKRSTEIVEVLLEYGVDINSILNIEARIRPNLCWQIIRKHIIKYKAAELHVRERILGSMNIYAGFVESNFQSECEEEINSMKRNKITNTNVSFYDIITESKNKLAIFSRNKNITLVKSSEEHKMRYPLYFFMIKHRIMKAIEREKLLTRIAQVSYSAYNNFHILPYECIEKILSCLDDEDLRNLIIACES